MIQLKCPHCTKEIRAAEEHAGKKIRCPKCKEVLTLPAADTAVQVAAPRQAPAPVKKGPPPIPKRPAVEDEEDVPVMEASEEDDDVPPVKRRRDEPDEDDEDEERQRRKRKKRKRRQGAYADCPNCDAPGDAHRVGFTWWGGLVGSAILCHVRCNDCGTCYNGRSGKSNNVAIAIYLAVGVVLGLILGGLAIGVAIMNHH